MALWATSGKGRSGAARTGKEVETGDRWGGGGVVSNSRASKCMGLFRALGCRDGAAGVVVNVGGAGRGGGRGVRAREFGSVGVDHGGDAAVGEDRDSPAVHFAEAMPAVV